MIIKRHYEDVPGAYPNRRPTPQLDLRPDDPSPEEKKAELKAIAEAAERATEILEEKPRRRA